jgi:hypothetical protein
MEGDYSVLKRLTKKTCLNNELTKHAETKLVTVAGDGDCSCGCGVVCPFLLFTFLRAILVLLSLFVITAFIAQTL